MGRIGRLLSFARRSRFGTNYSDAKGDMGGGDNNTPQHFGAPGDDAHPLPSDLFVMVPLTGTGRGAAVGYLDPKAVQSAGPGERRVYARDAAGQEVAQVWLQSDGSVVLSNANGGIVLGANGTVSINGVEIDPAGNISAPNNMDLAGALTAASVTADQIEALTSLIAALSQLVAHVHPAGDPPGNTGPNL